MENKSPLSGIIVVVTISYILAEIWLNFRLLDAFGTWNITQKEADDLEKIGRAISGIGLGVLLWKMTKKKIFNTYFFGLIFSIAIGIGAMSYGQQALVNYLVDHSSAEQRRLSYAMVNIAKSVANNALKINNFGLEANDIKAPEVKAFIAIMPSFAVLMPQIQTRISEQAKTIAMSAATSKLPPPQTLCDILIPAGNKLADAYDNDYLPGSGDVFKYRGNRNLALRQFNIEMEKRGIFNPPPPGLSWEKFSKDPSILVYLRFQLKEIGVNNESINLYRPGMSCDQIESKVWKPQVDALADSIRDRILSKPYNFEHGGGMEEDGVNAFRLAVVPPIALIASALFGTFNLVMFIAGPLSNRISFGHSFSLKAITSISRLAISVSILILILVLPMKMNNSVTNSVAFKSIESESAQRGFVSLLIASGLHWIINTQPVINHIPIPLEVDPMSLAERFRDAVVKSALKL